MRRQIKPKWRPQMGLVVASVLMMMLALPTIGIFVLRLISNHVGLQEAILWTGMAILAATAVIGYVLQRSLLRPILDLAERTEAIKRGDPDALAPLEHYGTAELRDLGQAVLDMGSTLQDRAATVRSYTDHVTHELKSPLTTIQGASELLSQGTLPVEEQTRLVLSIQDAADRMTTLLAAMRRLAAARDAQASGRSTLGDIRMDVAGLSISVAGNDQILPIDPEALSILLNQLAQNAASHTATTLHLIASASSDGTVLDVQDDGTGISEGNRGRVFQPFFTTRRESGGTGMGLTIVKTLVEASGGVIDLMPSTHGTRFRISWP
jgi:signal transduction histidine kinase